MAFLLLAGIAIGVSLILISGINVHKHAEINTNDGTIHFYKVESDQDYKIYATKKTTHSAARLLTHAEEPEIDVHYVFGENSEMVVTVHGDKTYEVHLNAELLAQEMAQ